MSHAVADAETSNERESSILSEIREAEKKASEIMERASKQKESLIHEARVNSSKLVSAKDDEIARLQEKKILDFRDKAKLIIEEKLAEGKIASKQLKSKSEKNTSKAVDFVLKKFEETI